MTDIAKQLQAARQNLLDLTMRNRLLNFRPTKLKTIQLIDAIPTDINDSLALREKAVEFLAKPATLGSNSTETTEDQELFAALQANPKSSEAEDTPNPQQSPSSVVESAEPREIRFLQTALASDELQKRLFYIDQQARSVL